MHSLRAPRRAVAALLLPLLASALGLTAIVGLATPASAAPPTYVIAGDVDTATGELWGLHEGYFSELRTILTDPANFGPNGKVRATFSIGTPRTVPLTPNSLNGLDVYFLAARDLVNSDITEIQRFRDAGGAVVVSSNAPGFFDDTQWLGLTLSPRVVYGDGPAPYLITHRAPAPSVPVAAQFNNPVLNGPFGTLSSFEMYHSVAGFTNTPGNGGTVLARTTLTGPQDASGSGSNITISNVATAVTWPIRSFGSSSGPVVAFSDVDAIANAYPLDGSTLTGTGNGTLARNTFAWVADQLMVLDGLSTFVPLEAPVRALDTRASTPFGGNVTRNLSLAAAGVPSDATMVAVNITAVDPTATGFLSAYPAGGGTPNVSSLNFTAGTTVANAAFVRLGVNGEITIRNSAGNTHVLVDVVGYGGASGSRLVNLNPARIKDTRSGVGGAGIAGPGITQNLQVTGAGGVPAGATAVILNVTAVDPTATSFVTVWPAGLTRPTVSNINTSVGTTVPNLVVVRLPTSGGNTGQISIYNAAGNTHLLVDVLGYFTSGAPNGGITGATPTRVLDTRPGAALGDSETRTVQTGIFGSRAVIINVTAVDPSATGYLTVYPGDGSRPNASNVNFYAGRTAPNLVVVQPAADGTIKVYNSAGVTHLLVDVVGRFDG